MIITISWFSVLICIMIAISLAALYFIIVEERQLIIQDRANSKSMGSMNAQMDVVQLRVMARDGNMEAIASLEELDANLKAQGQRGVIEEGEKGVFEAAKLKAQATE